MKEQNKLYIVRKYIWAKNVKEAVAKDRKTEVQDCWVDDEWKKNSSNPKDAIGFYNENSA